MKLAPRLAVATDRERAVLLVGQLLVELGGTALPETDAGAVFDELVPQSNVGFIVVGEADGELVAVCTVSFVRALRSLARYAIVQEMIVEPGVRSTGIGASVLHLALNTAATAGCRFVELGTPADGSRQVGFYARMGFVRAGERLRWSPA